MKDEFTTDMHNEMTIPEETEISHRVYSAKLLLTHNIKTLPEALKFYNLTQEQYNRYQALWVTSIDSIK